jgi:uncharacterized protein with HEPN domain
MKCSLKQRCSMPRHDDVIRMEHMLDHAREAVSLIENTGRKDLNSNRILSLALVRLLEIVGEAASHISKDTQSKYPSIPWAQVISLRNRLIHGYDSIDMDILWEILTKDFPLLIPELETILPKKTDE